MKTRICTAKGCRKIKPLSAFPKNKKRKLGVGNRCKECDAKRAKVNYYKKQLHILEKRRQWYALNRKEIRERGNKRSKIHWRKWYLKNKLKHNAREKLRYAVRRGKIIKPERCPVCKIKENLQGHHPDYSKPLDVEWLCGRCHEAVEHNLPNRIAFAKSLK